MAPSPEDDNTPKAPDKNEKTKCEKYSNPDTSKEKDKDEKTLSNLNDGELKALLDEAITYKNPKDREGKSKLFKDLLIQAEESERIARAASAGGSELVRHCNPSARRHGGGRHRRKPASCSASESLMHGGSLDNLAKEELFIESAHHLHRAGRKTVSARQREGGSLPCDVNSGFRSSHDCQFLEEARRNKALKDKEYTAIDMESENLLEHDALAQGLQDQASPGDVATPGAPKFTSTTTLHISKDGNVDDPIPLKLEDNVNNKKMPYDTDMLQKSLVNTQYSLYLPTSIRSQPEEKKVDENGNALHQNPGTKGKKKKIQADKNVVVLTAESVEGHRSDIINDVDKLMQYIGGDQEGVPSGRTKSSVHKSKQLNKQHASEDGGRGKKQRAHSSKGKEIRSELKKSNSLSEISTAKLDDFAFSGGEKDLENKVVLRQNKGQGDRPKERRSWGNVEPPPIQSLYSNASIENLEAAENWVVTKPKKKSKKRRNSVSSGRRQNSAAEPDAKQHRAPSPDLRGKSARSVPHSEKSNDSSDADSVHSLPIDGLNAPISYADIAKNSEKLKEKKVTPEKAEIKVVVKEKSTVIQLEPEPRVVVSTVVAEKYAVATPLVKNNPPPDVHNIKSFPAIPNNNNKTLSVSIEKANFKNNVSNKVKNVSPNNKIVNKASGNNNVKVISTGAMAVCAGVLQNDIQNDLSIIHSNERDCIQFNAQMMPPDIPDVQTIEKMHFMNRPPPSDAEPHLTPPPPDPSSVADDAYANVNCDSSERTISEDDETPPVIILSGIGNKEVSGLVFGFDVNEQLLNEDICESFVARWVAPDAFSQLSHNHDKIVNFIGTTWEAVVNQANGKVQYYSEES